MGPSAVIVAPNLPEADREGGSRDLADLVDSLLATGWSVRYIACTAQADERHATELRSAGVDLTVAPAGPEAALFPGPGPDLAIVAFWHLAEQALPLLRHAWPGTRVIVSSIDLHFLRSARRIFASVAQGTRSYLLDGFFSDDLAREVNTYAASDGVLAVSVKEAQLVNDLTGDPRLAWWVPVTQGEERSPLGFHDRQGLLFVGNFRHQPNVDAVEHLCREIVPRLDPALVAEHPVWLVGNAPDERVKRVAAATPGVTLVGWVPSLTPYLHHARATVVPLLHGAGVKGKLVRALAAGTPTVSTTPGVEGLDLVPGRDVLVADDPAEMAAAIEVVMGDPDVWQRLAGAGHDRIVAVHDPGAVRRRLLAAIDAVLCRPPKSAALADRLEAARPATRWAETARRLAGVAQARLDPSVPFLVVSKGDPALVAIDGIRAEHFPQGPDGTWLGWHPPDGADVRARLDACRAKGRHYLAIPEVSLWWLDHYDGLRAYLSEHYRLVVREDDTCLIWEHAGQPAAIVTEERCPGVVVPVDESLRPRVAAELAADSRTTAGRGTPSVLVVGVYMATRPNHAADSASVVAASRRCRVTQRWAALGGEAPTDALAAVTVSTVREHRGKFAILNDLLAEDDLDAFDYVVLLDDDLGLPHGFLDALVGWQARLGWALAQPARTERSFIDHRIVQRQPGVIARRTLFVEIGPVVSIHRSAMSLVLPFDLTSPMGWGYENVWSRRVEAAGLHMGVIDAVPVDHCLRPPAANYSWDDADEGRRLLLAGNEHRPLDECFRVLQVVTAADVPGGPNDPGVAA